jgi:peroxiredoxin
MAITSNELPLGSLCPDFSLPSVDGKHYARDDFGKSKGLLIAFICNHCPYVKVVEDRLIALAKAFSETELQMVAICSNDASEYPEDAPAELFERWKHKDYGFPYLVDEEQRVAIAFKAACTPDIFLYDQARKLYYHGRIDDNWKDASKVTKEELKEAIQSLVRGEAAPTTQVNTIGCSIKWRS